MSEHMRDWHFTGSVDDLASRLSEYGNAEVHVTPAYLDDDKFNERREIVALKIRLVKKGATE
jgi:hypothetical protein